MAQDERQGNGRSLQLLACLAQNTNEALTTYTHRLAALLGAELQQPAAGEHAQNRCDLLILQDADGLERAARQPAVLLLRQPRWPLQRLLLIIRGEATDKASIEWGMQLTQRSGCALTLLVVNPPANREREQSLAQALKANTIPGRHIREALKQLAAHRIEGVLKLSHRQPEQQVRQELIHAPYDLIILGSEPQNRLFFWRLDSLLTPLLQWTQQPVLIAGLPRSPHTASIYKTNETTGEQTA